MILRADARYMPIADGSVNCVVTSPPYWGLRDYGLEPSVWPGEKHCNLQEHIWGGPIPGSNRGGSGTPTNKNNRGEGYGRNVERGTVCLQCGAWRGNLGLEPTPELYVQHIVEIFREVKRVLRDDGTVWLNLGDSYAGTHAAYTTLKQRWQHSESQGAAPHRTDNRALGGDGLKTKDLCGIPWRAAFALQADGWYLRSDIIWSKPNPMPESVRDRPTRSHEYIFLLSKNQRYYFDQDAVKEPSVCDKMPGTNMIDTRLTYGALSGGNSGLRDLRRRYHKEGTPTHRNIRSVWTWDSKEEFLAELAVAAEEIPGFREKALALIKRGRLPSVWDIATQPYSEAHFATFPEKLVEPCIKAGCPQAGVVLDPFAGSGTVGRVATRLRRKSILLDLKYHELSEKRNSDVQIELPDGAQ